MGESASGSHSNGQDLIPNPSCPLPASNSWILLQLLLSSGLEDLLTEQDFLLRHLGTTAKHGLKALRKPIVKLDKGYLVLQWPPSLLWSLCLRTAPSFVPQKLMPPSALFKHLFSSSLANHQPCSPPVLSSAQHIRDMSAFSPLGFW